MDDEVVGAVKRVGLAVPGCEFAVGENEESEGEGEFD